MRRQSRLVGRSSARSPEAAAIPACGTEGRAKDIGLDPSRALSLTRSTGSRPPGASVGIGGFGLELLEPVRVLAGAEANPDPVRLVALVEEYPPSLPGGSTTRRGVRSQNFLSTRVDRGSRGSLTCESAEINLYWGMAYLPRGTGQPRPPSSADQPCDAIALSGARSLCYSRWMDLPTMFLSRLIGLAALILGAAMLIYEPPLVSAVELAASDRSALFTLGGGGIIAGLAIVLTHNVWRQGLCALVVTAVGWFMLIRGVLMVFLPTAVLLKLDAISHFHEHPVLYAVLPLALGLYLTWQGFLVRRG